MAETEVSQTWVSTGRGGAGNFPYTPRALSKRPVTVTAPVGREVDYRKQGIARSGRGGVGYWGPALDENAKAQQVQDFERDQEIIKERVIKQQNDLAESQTFKSGRGGAGNIGSPTEPTLPTTTTNHEGQEQENPLERVHSFGRGGGNFRYGDAIPLVEMNRIETEERIEAKSKPASPTSPTESGFATFASYASAFLNSLTPAENRIENMSSSSPTATTPTSPTANKRVSIGGGGGRGGAGNIGYATYRPSASRNNSSSSSNNNSYGIPSPTSTTAGPTMPTRAHLGPDNRYAAYSSASYAQGDYDPERPPVASSSSSTSYPSSSSASSSSAWA